MEHNSKYLCLYYWLYFKYAAIIVNEVTDLRGSGKARRSSIGRDGGRNNSFKYSTYVSKKITDMSPQTWFSAESQFSEEKINNKPICVMQIRFFSLEK